MKTWTPLFSSIIESSLWGESKDVKILFVTMLAKKDANGFVEASLPGLARAAVLTLEECRVAMDVLEKPDPYSRTADNEGKRVLRVKGGWMVLNHDFYRAEIERMRKERRREYQRIKQAEYRTMKKGALPGEQRAVEAMKNGDEALADRITTESLPNGGVEDNDGNGAGHSHGEGNAGL